MRQCNVLSRNLQITHVLGTLSLQASCVVEHIIKQWEKAISIIYAVQASQEAQGELKLTPQALLQCKLCLGASSVDNVACQIRIYFVDVEYYCCDEWNLE